MATSINSEGITWTADPGIPLGPKVVTEYVISYKGEGFMPEFIQADELMIFNGWMLFYRNNEEVYRAAESEVRSMKRKPTVPQAPKED